MGTWYQTYLKSYQSLCNVTLPLHLEQYIFTNLGSNSPHLTEGRMYFVICTVPFFASPSFSRDVVFQFSVLCLGLALPKCALLGGFDPLAVFFRRGSLSFQFDGLGGGHCTRPWGGEKSKRRRRRGHCSGLLGSVPTTWVPLGTSLHWPQLQAPHLKWRVGLKILWGFYTWLSEACCVTWKTLSSTSTLYRSLVGPKDWVVWRWASRNSQIYMGSCLSPGLWVPPVKGRWVVIAVATGDQAVFS